MSGSRVNRAGCTGGRWPVHAFVWVDAVSHSDHGRLARRRTTRHAPRATLLQAYALRLSSSDLAGPSA